MHSKRLKEEGLLNVIGGKDFNFRATNTEEALIRDYKRLLEKAEITEPTALYSGHQTHSTNIAYADGTNGESYLFGKRFGDTDGLITDKRNIALVIKFADCTPVVLYDPVQKVQAIVHSGWRGTVGEISKLALQKMTEEFGAKKDNILAYLGPSIDQENYEVGGEVYDAFSMNPDRDRFFKSKGEKYVLDMLKANYHLLLQAGIPKENIEMESASTFTDDRLHSARQEGRDYALNAMVTCMI
ncbi:MAG TPA: peptidoglycan editing factor PgeF [Atopostipes sp.]|nr:peptidoglycan editing factor PgeF [Atopostipes sp.]